MECQGTVYPSGVTTEVEFNFERKKWARTWFSSNGTNWNLEYDYTPWQEDDLREDDEDKTPSEYDHIYQIDGPGLPWKDRPPNYVAHLVDLKEWVMVKIDGSWYQCSDYYKWHSKVRTQPKDSNWVTREPMDFQQLGQGWIYIGNDP